MEKPDMNKAPEIKITVSQKEVEIYIKPFADLLHLTPICSACVQYLEDFKEDPWSVGTSEYEFVSDLKSFILNEARFSDSGPYKGLVKIDDKLVKNEYWLTISGRPSIFILGCLFGLLENVRKEEQDIGYDTIIAPLRNEISNAINNHNN